MAHGFSCSVLVHVGPAAALCAFGVAARARVFMARSSSRHYDEAPTQRLTIPLRSSVKGFEVSWHRSQAALARLVDPIEPAAVVRSVELTDGLPQGPLLLLVLRHAAGIQDGEANLQGDQGVSAVVPAPEDPEDIAEEKEPEAPLTTLLFQRGDKPGGEKGDRHRPPLYVIHPFHFLL